VKVDMSPKAVKARLLELNDLWELSVRLMNNKKVQNIPTKTVRKQQGDNSPQRQKPVA